MFNKIGKSGGQSVWNAKLADLEVGIGAKWYAGETGSTVFVTVVNLNTGETVEKRGTMRVEKTILSNRVMIATVESLNGDVQGQDRTVKGAAEEYASRVAQIVAHEWAKPKPTTADCELPPAGEEPTAKLRTLIEQSLQALEGGAFTTLSVKLKIAARLAEKLDPNFNRPADHEVGDDAPAGAGFEVEADRG